MAKSKTANAIVHSVYMGDGVRLYYEKTDMSVYRGEEAIIIRDLYVIVKNIVILFLYRKWSDVVDYVTKREPTWPPHSLFCDCRKCVRAHSNYKKVMKG